MRYEEVREMRSDLGPLLFSARRRDAKGWNFPAQWREVSCPVCRPAKNFRQAGCWPSGSEAPIRIDYGHSENFSDKFTLPPCARLLENCRKLAFGRVPRNPQFHCRRL